MNSEKVVNFTGSIVIFFVLLFVYSKWGPSFPVSVLTQSKGEPMVVSGMGKVTVVPDIAKVSIGLEEQGTNLKQVQQTADLKAKNLKAQIIKLGVSENAIKTTQYNVYPTYDYSERTQRITGYRVSTSYEVKVTNFDIVNDVITAATSAGANNIGGISLEVNDETKKEKLQEAREIAVKEAKQKAEGLARASGITLGKLINVTEDSMDGGYPRPYMALEKSAVGMGGAADAVVASPANIEPGESELQVSVTLSYEVR
jgi:uncharacterized protein YggE